MARRVEPRLGLAALLMALAASAPTTAIAARPEAETSLGPVRGVWTRTARGAEVAGFLGLPYAEPPLGELRFENPRPWTQKWEEVRDASQDGSMCLQLRGRKVVGNEDCLYLNVFTPTIKKNESGAIEQKLPVLFFVHGGTYSSGSNNSTMFSPIYLLDHEIVLVTVNYRLNVLGFFSTGNEVTPGNCGLKDVVEALRWTRRNVEAFGGDPESVTAVGSSAGAALVQLLSASKSTEGLFHKLITMSGSATSAFSFHSTADIRRSSLRVARRLNCTGVGPDGDFDADPGSGEDEVESTTSTYEPKEVDRTMVECMKKASASDIVAEGSWHVWRQEPWGLFGPTLEPEAEGAILTVHPARSLAEGLYRDMPWITGLTRDEGLQKATDFFIVPGMAEDFLGSDYAALMMHLLELGNVIDNATAATEAIVDFYFDGDIETNFMSNITQCIGDGAIRWASFDILQKQVERMKSNVFFYVFSYEGTFSHTFRGDMLYRFGVSHGDDLNYLFPFLNAQYADLQLFNDMNDWTMINIVCEMWVSFAWTGVPSARLTSSWEPYRTARRYLRLGSGHSFDRAMESNYLPERMAFWSELMANFSVSVTEARVGVAVTGVQVGEKEEGKEKEEEEDGTDGVAGTNAALGGPTFLLALMLLLLLA